LLSNPAIITTLLQRNVQFRKRGFLMDFEIPADVKAYLSVLDDFIETEIKPIEERDDNIRFFDHRREYARTDFENGGLPRKEWEDLLHEARQIADKAGHLRFTAPKRYGGQDGSNLAMAIIRDHLTAKGLGLHNDLQNEHSIVGNFPFVAMFEAFGTEAQQQEFIPGGFDGSRHLAFGLTEPKHGSDATHMETTAVRETRDGIDGWLINGEKMWTTGMHVATHCLTFCRTSGEAGSARGLTALIVPTDTPGVKVEEYMWTFNMPTDHPRVSFTNVWVPDSAVLGDPMFGLSLAQSFVHQNRIRQAASSLGAAHYCVQESVRYARKRKPFGE
jgi:acyl-CoA dehydrogenase